MSTRKFVLIALVFSGLMVPIALFAAPAPLWVVCGNLPGCSAGAGWTDYIYPALMILKAKLPSYAEILGSLFIMIGGAYILLSTGNAERVTKGKNTIIWAVAGIFLVQAAESLVNAILAESAQGNLAGTPNTDIIESAGLTLIGTVQDLFYVALLGVAIYNGMRMAITFGKTEEFTKAKEGLFWAAVGAIIVNWAGLILAAFQSM